MAIDTSNDYLVGARGDGLVVMRPPRSLTMDEALRFAAWLVVMADGQGEHRFSDVLSAVEET